MPEEPEIDVDKLNERIHEEIEREGGALLKTIALPSRPGEFHPQSLTDSGRETLASSGSCHRAKTAAFRREKRALPVASWPAPNVGDLLPLLHGHYPASWLLRSSPPLSAASVLLASQVRCLYLFPWHRRIGSQVPYESPNESHASYTPDTVWPVGRFPPHSSWSSGATPVLMPSKAFRCVTRGSLALISLIHT